MSASVTEVQVAVQIEVINLEALRPVKQTTCCKLLSPSGASFFVLESQPAEADASSKEDRLQIAPLRFFSNLLDRLPLKTRRREDGLNQ